MERSQPFHVRLPMSADRRRADQIMDAARCACTGFAHQEAMHKEIYAALAGLRSMRALKVLDEGDYCRDSSNRCDRYTFHTVKRESWAKPGKSLDVLFLPDAVGFLANKGYQLLSETPRTGDVVAYAHNDPRHGFEHFGVYEQPNTVVSKWGRGPVIRHPLALIPAEDFGHVAYFLRKAS